jgi:hypothetical protein
VGVDPGTDCMQMWNALVTVTCVSILLTIRNEYIRFNGEEFCSNKPIRNEGFVLTWTQLLEGIMRHSYKASRAFLF